MAVQRRRFGSVELSQISLGTMRLPELVDERPATDFLCDLAEAGLTTHHSSTEYETHEVYLEALATARARGMRFQHIVKLSEPSWDHKTFDPVRLIGRVETELNQLGTDRLDVVQWLVRTPDPNDDQTRVEMLRSQAAEIAETFNELRLSGRIGEVAVFAYTRAFAEAVLATGVATGFTVYLNPLELDDADLLNNSPCIAIRPFAGARLEIGPDVATFPLLHPNTASMMFSASSRRHADQVISWAGEVEGDIAAFTQALRAVGR